LKKDDIVELIESKTKIKKEAYYLYQSLNWIWNKKSISKKSEQRGERYFFHQLKEIF